ncbi:hypothetical protein [Pseudonocardia alni]|uniref:hypothetical protein n=1 Tax=Pseudonocardia alni TaxID=33907 RepID=UPI0033321980
MAARIASSEPSDDGFGLVGWTPERELLADTAEILMSLRSVLIAANSKDGKAPKFPRMPRPKTAVDRARAAAAKRKRSDLLAQLTPHHLHAPT